MQVLPWKNIFDKKYQHDLSRLDINNFCWQMLATKYATFCHKLPHYGTLWHKLSPNASFQIWNSHKNKTHKNLAHRKILVTKNVTFKKFWCQKMSHMKNFNAIFIHKLSYKRVYYGTGIDQRLVKLVCWHFGHFFVFGQFR